MKEQFIKLAPPFQGFTEQELEIVTTAFAEGQRLTGAKLLNAGEHSDAMYLISQGFVRLTNESGYNLATLGPGSLLGEASLLRAAPQELSAIAATDVEFWSLSDRSLRHVILQHPSIGLKLGQNFGGRVAQMTDYLLQRLSRINEFASLPANTLEAVADILQPRRIASTQMLYRAGEAGGNLYIVESGSFELREDSAPGAANKQYGEPGSILGATALLTSKPHNHSAIATTDSLVWVIPSEKFQALNSRHPGLRRSLSRNIRTPLSRQDSTLAASRLAQMPIFAELPSTVLQSIASRLYLQHVPAGDRVYRSGDAGDALYMIESGEVELSGENSQGILEERARISDGGYFGELSLLNGQVRVEDATARRNSNLWVLRKADMDSLIVQYPAIGKALNQGLTARLSSSSDDSERFRNFPVLAELNNGELHQIVEVLRPTRFRAGEQIFRINTPSDTLFLIERGEVRLQQIGGESWHLGKGEIFGERSLLTNQPNNASAVAETDVDLFTLNKRDFEAIARRNPALGLNVSRALSDYLRQPVNNNAVEYEDDDFQAAPAPVEFESNASNRRRQATTTPLPRRQAQPAESTTQGGFGQWFADLSLMGKINTIFLFLLLLVLIGVLLTVILTNFLPSSPVANGAAYAPMDALRRVMRQGSYDLANLDQDAARTLALADSQIPPTPTYTPFPTATPIPVAGVAVDAAPIEAISLQQGVFVENFQAAGIASSAAEVSVQETAVPAENTNAEAVVAAASAPSRVWDGRLDQLGVKVTEASVAPGQQYWKLIEARWEDEQQAGGRHHLYVEVRDENGSRIAGQPVTVFWGDGFWTSPTEDKAPPDYGWNYQMYAAGYAYGVKVEGLPSDSISGAGLGDLNLRFHRIHVAYYFVFQKATK